MEFGENRVMHNDVGCGTPPLQIVVRSWNRRVTQPKTLSVACPHALLNREGKRLKIETHSLRSTLSSLAPRVFSSPVMGRIRSAANIDSFFFSPIEELLNGGESEDAQGTVAEEFHPQVTDFHVFSGFGVHHHALLTL